MKLWLTFLATLLLAACASQKPVETPPPSEPPRAETVKPPLAPPTLHRYLFDVSKVKDLNDVKLLLSEIAGRVGFAMNSGDPLDMEKYGKLKHLLREMP